MLWREKGGKQRTRDYSGGEQVVGEFKESRDEAVFSLLRHSAFLTESLFPPFTVLRGLVLQSGVPLLSVKCF